MLVKDQKRVTSYDFMVETAADISYYAGDTNNRVGYYLSKHRCSQTRN